MSEVIRIHRQTCPSFQPVVDLSIDGVQECKSSSLSSDVYSVSFHGCKTVYPVKIIRPINKYKVDDQLHLEIFVKDILDNSLRISCAVFDNPKRSTARCALCFSASFACEYCESRAEYIRDPEKNTKGHLAWPFSTCKGTPRTRENILDIIQKIENNEELTRDQAKGFWGRSVFLDIEHFDFVSDIQVEYMHSGCLGVGKRLIELTFNIGEVRKRNTKRKLSDVSVYNKLISVVQVFREFSRRIRNLDFGVIKAQEFRNIILFFFVIVLQCIPDDFPQEKKIWLQIAFVMRSCVIPNKEFEKISTNVISNTAMSFYKNFESVYGKKNCSYSIHVFPSHVLQIRGDQPLTSRSAFKYENFYSEMKNLFQPGTIAPAKQVLQNCYMKRQLEQHNCEKSIFFDVQKRGKEDNSLIYYVDDNAEYQFFRIIKINDNGTFTCNPQGRYEFKFDLVKDLKWEKVGVFKVGPYSSQEIVVPRNKIEGKVLKVNDYFLTCPNNVLREQ